jgi:hypothetical protein
MSRAWGTNEKIVYRILVGLSDGKRPLGRSDVGEKIILKLVLDRMGVVLNIIIWVKVGTSEGPAGSIKC